MINMNEIDAILFDFGGTLDTNGVHWSEKFWEVYQSFQIPINYKIYREAYINSEPNVQKLIDSSDNLFTTLKTQVQLQLEYLSNQGVFLPACIDSLSIEIGERCYNDVISKISDIKPTLNTLQLVVSLGLVSNFYGNVKSVCKDLGIDSYFKVIVDSAELKISKPDLQIFKTAIDLLNVSADRTVVIGDSYDRDIIPAKKLGCKTIWLEGKSWKRQENTLHADLIINSIRDIEEYFLKKVDESTPERTRI